MNMNINVVMSLMVNPSLGTSRYANINVRVIFKVIPSERKLISVNMITNINKYEHEFHGECE